MRRVGTLRFRLAAGVVTLGLLITLGFSLGVVPTYERDLRGYETSRAELYATMVSRAHGRRAQSALVELERIAALPDVVTMERARIDPLLTAFDATTSAFVHFSVYDLTGTVVSRPDRPSRVGANRSSDAHVEGPLRTGGTVVGPVRISPSGNLALTIGTPIRREGVVVGVLGGSLGLADRNPDLYRDVLDPPLPAGWDVWLVSGDGSLIARSGGPPMPASGGIFDATAHRGVAIAMATHERTFEFDEGGRRWIAAAASVEPTDWRVIAAVPKDIVESAVARTTRPFSIVGLVAIVGLIGLTFLLTSYVSRRLAHLTSALKAYGAGVDTPVAPGSADEIGEALRAFNLMIEERQRAEQERNGLLKQSERYLTELLEQRTERLWEAQEAVRSREDFISVAAHELNTPLTSLQLMLQGLRPGLLGTNPDRLNHSIELAERQGRKLAALVDMLLGVGRGVAGSPMMLQRERLDLVEIAREAAVQHGADLQRSRSTLTIHAEAPVIGRWDRRRVEQIFTNLLGNAIKFGKGKPIEVTIEKRDETALLVIADHGIGIAPDQVPTIFDRFKRGVSASQYGGLGLGLSIVREIVSAHGGTVTADSSLGQGATFTVELPCEGPPGVEERAPSP